MVYLRSVELHLVLEHVGVKWAQLLPGLNAPQKAVWHLATSVRDGETTVEKSRFYKSLKDECDDKSKKGSLAVMVRTLRHAVMRNDYQAAIKEQSGIDVKEAFSFSYRGQNHKVWELKYQKKDRLYFSSHQGVDGKHSRILIPMLFHHKKDENTPTSVSNYCETAMRQFLDPSKKIKII